MITAISPTQAKDQSRQQGTISYINACIVKFITQMGNSCPVRVSMRGYCDALIIDMCKIYDKVGWHPYFDFTASELVLCYSSEQLGKFYAECVRRHYCEK